MYESKERRKKRKVNMSERKSLEQTEFQVSDWSYPTHENQSLKFAKNGKTEFFMNVHVRKPT